MAEVSEEALANDTKPKTERGGGDWEEGLEGGGVMGASVTVSIKT